MTFTPAVNVAPHWNEPPLSVAAAPLQVTVEGPDSASVTVPLIVSDVVETIAGAFDQRHGDRCAVRPFHRAVDRERCRRDDRRRIRKRDGGGGLIDVNGH